MVWDRTLARRARVAGIALVLAACTGGGLAGTRIPAAELRELVPGATLAGTVAGGGTFEGTYHRDGTSEIHTRKDGVADSDTGTWDFEGDTVCLTWQRWREGKRYCLYWVREDPGYAAFFLDGRLSTRFTIVND